MESEGEEPQLSPGTRLGQYEVARVIGSGGMGSVYEGVHTGLKKRVAIKTLHKSVAAIPEARARFLREGEAASRIHHPNVVSVFDLGTHEGSPYLVMEFLEGEDLASLLARRGVLSPAEIADVMLPVCAAVNAAHDGGVVHRDLKPQNVFLARDGAGKVRPTVLDFGVSKLVDPGAKNVTHTAALLGTPLYMAPEQAEGAGRADSRADQFSLGVILYECAVGRTPYDADSFGLLIHQIISAKFEPPRAHRPGLAGEFEAVILRAMAHNPAARYASVRELGAALVPFATESARVLWADAFGPPPQPIELRATAPSVPGVITADGRPTAPKPAGVALTSPGDVPPSSAPVRTSTRSARWPALVGAGLLACLTAAAAIALRPSGTPTATPPVRATTNASGSTVTDTHPLAPGAPGAFHLRVTAAPATAAFELDGAPAGTGSIERDVPRDGVEHRLTVSAPGYLTRTVQFRDAPPPESLDLSPDPAAPTRADTAAAGNPGDESEDREPRGHGNGSSRRNPGGGGVHRSGPHRRGANGALILR